MNLLMVQVQVHIKIIFGVIHSMMKDSYCYLNVTALNSMG